LPRAKKEGVSAVWSVRGKNWEVQIKEVKEPAVHLLFIVPARRKKSAVVLDGRKGKTYFENKKRSQKLYSAVSPTGEKGGFLIPPKKGVTFQKLKISSL